MAGLTPKVPVLDLFNLKGQLALVTGGSRGIGRACALALAEAGADIILASRTSSSCSETKAAVEAAGRECRMLECDLGDLTKVKTLVEDAAKLWDGRNVDVVINCAGIQRRNNAVEFTEEDWDEVINVNLKSVWLICQSAGRHMLPRRRGKIINFASLLTFQGGIRVPAYAASKGGLAQFTKALSNEWAKDNVQVNCIAPGYIDTDMNEALIADPVRSKQISERIPAGRWGTPEDFKGPVLFLASQASQYMSGETIVVDGGWMGR
ncbi:NAD(P)-binding protein [Atractiella rhizophila]|nr:NAD(P)-binding protein [Atractiella rhizophila]